MKKVTQSKEQLCILNKFYSALNYKEGDKICFQYVNDTDSKIAPIAPKNQLIYNFPLTELPPHFEPFSIYTVVNGQGFLAKDINYAVAIFCEFDNMLIAEQREFWKKYNLPEPTVQVYTGGKSIHHYWVFNTRLFSLKEWKDLMIDLINLTGADKANKNPNRLLRPPTFGYIDKNSGKFTGENATILKHTGKTYSYVHLRSIIPNSRIKSTVQLNNSLYNNSTNDSLALSALDCIPCDDYQIWLDVGMALKAGNFDISVWDKWSSKSSKYNSQEIVKKWDSFDGTGITIATIFYYAKDYGFKYPTKQVYNSVNNRKQLEKTYQKYEDTSNNELAILINNFVDKYSDSNILDDERNIAITEFSTIHKIPSYSIVQSIKARQDRLERQDDLDLLKIDFDDLINTPNLELDLEYILGDYMAILLRKTAQQIPTNPDAIFTCLLPVLASVIGTRSKITVNQKTGYVVPFILRTMIVGKSGNKKSPTARVAVDPLLDLTKDAFKKYQQDLKELEKSENSEENTEPLLKRHLIQDSTFDGLIKVHSENPNGFLCYVDELSGYFKRMNKFHNGDDLQRDLELFEGKALIKTRVDEKNNIFLERTAVSITGTIQEVALKEIFSSENDLTGVSARWNIWGGKMPLGKLPKRENDDDPLIFSDILKGFLECLLEMDISNELKLSDNAYELLRQWQHEIMDKIKELPFPQLESKYSKIESEVIKFAGIFHYFHLHFGDQKLIDKETPYDEKIPIEKAVIIDEEIMKRAIEVGNYYLKHFAYILTKCQDNLLNSQLLKILELLNRKGTITASDIRHGIREFKESKAKDINPLLLNLVEIGKAKLVTQTLKTIKIEKV